MKPRSATFQQDPRIHAEGGDCVCGAKSCPQCKPQMVRAVDTLMSVIRAIARDEARNAVENPLETRALLDPDEQAVAFQSALVAALSPKVSP